MKKQYDNEIKMEIVSKSCNEAFARIAVAAFASQLDPTIEEISDIKTSVSEIVTNSIIHAYESSDEIIKIHCMIIDRTIIIEISDTGKGIEDIEEEIREGRAGVDGVGSLGKRIVVNNEWWMMNSE